MSAPGTGIDTLVAYLSGANADGGTQTDPAASLGGYRSSTRAAGLGVLVSNPIAGIRVDWASPGNGVGAGLLEVAGDDSVRWTPPDAAPGEAVTISNGQQRLITASSAAKYVLATRTTADALAGSSVLTLTRSFNDLFGGTDVDLDTETGDPRYRLLVLKNAGTALIRSLLVWLGTCDGPAAIAREDPSSQPSGYFQTIANQTTAPTAVTFVSPTSAVHADVISVPTLLPGYMVGIWCRRTPTGLSATPRADFAVNWSYSVVG
jgi:hypothetical protein